MTTQHTPRLLRLPQIIGNPKAGIPPLIPVSRSTWFEGIRTGRFPAPVKFSNGRASFWREDAIYALIEQAGAVS